MRLYTFCNYYLSSIQQGIQSAHVLGEMFVSIDPSYEAEMTMLFDWAKNHKTMVVLNGGNSDELINLSDELRTLAEALNLPHADFYEDAQSLNSAMTCVGIVVPEKVYAYNDFERERVKQKAQNDVFLINPYELNSYEKQLADIIARYPLAR